MQRYFVCVLNKFIVTASNRLLFDNCGPRWINLNFVKLFLHNGLRNTFLGFIVCLLVGFSV